MAASAKVKQKTAAILIVGDEILRGQTLDTNSQVLCKVLYGLRIPVRRITVIPDQVDQIAKEVACLASAHDYVLTTGGIGPTHDDVTYVGVALAFGRPLVCNPVLVNLFDEVFGGNRDHPAFKMSEVPENSRVLIDKEQKNPFPLVVTDNVYMLPGVPLYVERSLPHLVTDLRPHSREPPQFRSIYVGLDELSVTRVLNEAVKRFQASVTFGSYPSTNSNYYKVQITMESDEDEMAEAEAYLRGALPEGAVVRYEPHSVAEAGRLLFDRLSAPARGAASASANGGGGGGDECWFSPVADAVGVLEECLCRRYAPSDVCISFNGGKDCTALLHLYRVFLQRHHPDRNDRIAALYVRSSESFPEVERFVKETVVRYNLDLFEVKGNIKSGVQEFLSARPNIRAILIGNRRTDPHSEDLLPFQETDPSWPKVMRVFPLLDWTYRNVWQFLRHFYVPYCTLYDRGYTSLGNQHNTAPNPSLKYVDQNGSVSYHPAYRLSDGDKERNGRH